MRQKFIHSPVRRRRQFLDCWLQRCQGFNHARALNLLGSSVRNSLKNLRDCSGAIYGMIARRWQPAETATRAARVNVIHTHHELATSRAASTPQLAEKRPLFALTWIRRTLCFKDTFHSCQRCLQAIEAIIQIFGQKSVLMGHYYQLYGDQENAGFKQEAVAETLDEKSDNEQNKRCDDN